MKKEKIISEVLYEELTGLKEETPISEPYHGEQSGLNGVKKRLLASFILFVISFALLWIAARHPRIAEWYSVNVYSLIVSVLGRFSGYFPFSVAELGFYTFVVLVIGTLVRAVVRSVREKQGKLRMLRWLSGILLTASVLMLAFVLNCGINYRRVSFSEKSGIQMEEFTIQDLACVCIWLTEEVNDRAGMVERDEAGVMTLAEDEREAAVAAMEQLGEKYPALSGYYPKPKKLFLSSNLSYLSLSGIYSAFTVEANYNGDMTDYNKPFTACHELSHLRGFMQEEEANFIAFLACKDAKRDDFQYSGYLMAWIYCMNELHRLDYESWKEIRATLKESVEADLQANSRFWANYESVMEDVSDKVNDTYLKVNGQSDGVKSYDKMVNLVVTYYLEKEGAL